MNSPVTSIIVVGGGAAGWVTAGRIAAQHNEKSENSINVTLVESPNTPIIGVGEGTWPTMRNTLLKLGISETELIRECDTSFKQGAKFSGWVDGGDFYYHPLMLPQGFGSINLAPYWAASQKMQDCSFSNAVCFQKGRELVLAGQCLGCYLYPSKY